jgi:hypothetical protein
MTVEKSRKISKNEQELNRNCKYFGYWHEILISKEFRLSWAKKWE